MVAPSKNFTIIPDADVDPDSPLTTTLVTGLRDNDIHNEEWIGKDFVAAQNHDHDGVNSKLITGGFLFGDNVVDGTTRSTSSGSFVDVPGTSITIPSAQLPSDRTVLASGVFELRTLIAPGPAEVRLVIDGIVVGAVSAATTTAFVRFGHLFSLLLFSGTTPIVKLQFRALGAGPAEIRKTHVVIKLME